VSLIVISGPTASGKSHLGGWISNLYSAKIINADSIQVYDVLPILTAQPNDLRANHQKYSLYGVLEYGQKCTVAKWVELASKEIHETINAGKVPILVGGTGLYIKALLEGVVAIPDVEESIRHHVRLIFDNLGKENFYVSLLERDPGISAKVHANDTTRMIRAMEVFEQTGSSILNFRDDKKKFYEGRTLHLSLFPERDKLYQWCDERFDKMLQLGAVDEVEEFMEMTSASDRVVKYPVEYALGYEEIKSYINGAMSLEYAKALAKQRTRNYSKRQTTWFRHQVKEKHCISYQSLADIDLELMDRVKRFLA